MKRVALVLSLIFLGGGGCVNLEKDYPQRQSFALAASRPEGLVPYDGRQKLQVRRVEISPRFSSPSLAYRTGDLTYENDFYNRLLSSPATLLTEEIRRWLAKAGLAEGSDAWGEADFMLVAEVPAIYGDFRGRPQSVLEIEFALLDFRTADPERLWSNRYRQEVPLEETSPQGVVRGWNKALVKILADLETDLRQVLEGVANEGQTAVPGEK